jgi:hypothetical protein
VDGGEAKRQSDRLVEGILIGLVVAGLAGLLGHLNQLGALVLALGAYVFLVAKTARPFQVVREESLGHPVSLGTIVLQLTLVYVVLVVAAVAVFGVLFD